MTFNVLCKDLDIGEEYIVQIKASGIPYMYRGLFNTIHVKEFCTLYEFINVTSPISKYPKILIDPFNNYIEFYDAPKTLRQLCWNVLSNDEKKMLQQYNLAI